jgi:phosphoribosylaminoimidazolecarboxamide formyltransferase/IMP cyclohydrolase
MARVALLSTYDKTNLVEFARSLVEEFGFELLSSGGTARTLTEAGLPVTQVSEYTGSPEMLGGRVKTLHPKIHGGILARRDISQDQQDLEDSQIRAIDLVVVNLYPFEQTIAQPGVSLADAIEQIDIGGPTLLRSAAKNFQHVTVLCSPQQYQNCLEDMRQNQGTPSDGFRQDCAAQAFWHTTVYDQAIAAYLSQQSSAEVTSAPTMPQQYAIAGHQIQALRYGENPHQTAAWYQIGSQSTGWAAAEKLQGKELSYNNLVDLEAARAIIAEFMQPDTPPCAAVLKHTNPCGVAQASRLVEAYENAFAADSVSAFGGIVALNRAIDTSTATALTKTFLECVVAPGCEAEAADILKKKSKVRVLTLENLLDGPTHSVKAIAGGFLVQSTDQDIEGTSQWKVVTQKEPSPEQWEELLFAWKACKHVKSNAIVITRDRATIGIGAGQMNRVGAAKIALEQAGDRANGAVLASDGFFPFDDTVRNAATQGIQAIVQPGGSLRDNDSIAAANELGIPMILTNVRHFLH